MVLVEYLEASLAPSRRRSWLCCKCRRRSLLHLDLHYDGYDHYEDDGDGGDRHDRRDENGSGHRGDESGHDAFCDRVDVVGRGRARGMLVACNANVRDGREGQEEVEEEQSMREWEVEQSNGRQARWLLAVSDRTRCSGRDSSSFRRRARANDPADTAYASARAHIWLCGDLRDLP